MQLDALNRVLAGGRWFSFDAGLEAVRAMPELMDALPPMDGDPPVVIVSCRETIKPLLRSPGIGPDPLVGPLYRLVEQGLMLSHAAAVVPVLETWRQMRARVLAIPPQGRAMEAAFQSSRLGAAVAPFPHLPALIRVLAKEQVALTHTDQDLEGDGDIASRRRSLAIARIAATLRPPDDRTNELLRWPRTDEVRAGVLAIGLGKLREGGFHLEVDKNWAKLQEELSEALFIDQGGIGLVISTKLLALLTLDVSKFLGRVPVGFGVGILQGGTDGRQTRVTGLAIDQAVTAMIRGKVEDLSVTEEMVVPLERALLNAGGRQVPGQNRTVELGRHRFQAELVGPGVYRIQARICEVPSNPVEAEAAIDFEALLNEAFGEVSATTPGISNRTPPPPTPLANPDRNSVPPRAPDLERTQATHVPQARPSEAERNSVPPRPAELERTNATARSRTAEAERNSVPPKPTESERTNTNARPRSADAERNSVPPRTADVEPAPSARSKPESNGARASDFDRTPSNPSGWAKPEINGVRASDFDRTPSNPSGRTKSDANGVRASDFDRTPSNSSGRTKSDANGVRASDFDRTPSNPSGRARSEPPRNPVPVTRPDLKWDSDFYQPSIAPPRMLAEPPMDIPAPRLIEQEEEPFTVEVDDVWDDDDTDEHPTMVVPSARAQTLTAATPEQAHILPLEAPAGFSLFEEDEPSPGFVVSVDDDPGSSPGISSPPEEPVAYLPGLDNRPRYKPPVEEDLTEFEMGGEEDGAAFSLVEDEAPEDEEEMDPPTLSTKPPSPPRRAPPPPDFSHLLSGYNWYPEGRTIIFGRNYGNRLVDYHRIDSADPAEAHHRFLQQKIQESFIQQYDRTGDPPNGVKGRPLDTELLKEAWARLA